MNPIPLLRHAADRAREMDAELMGLSVSAALPDATYDAIRSQAYEARCIAELVECAVRDLQRDAEPAGQGRLFGRPGLRVVQ